MNTLQRQPEPCHTRPHTAPLALADVDARERWVQRARDARSRYLAGLAMRLGQRARHAVAVLRAASVGPAHHA